MTAAQYLAIVPRAAQQGVSAMSTSEFLAVAFAGAVTFLGLIGIGIYLSYKQLPSGNFEKHAILKAVSTYSIAAILSCGVASWYLGKGFINGALLPFEAIFRLSIAAIKSGLK